MATAAQKVEETEAAIASLKSAIAVLEADEAAPDAIAPYRKGLAQMEAKLTRLQKPAKPQKGAKRVPARTK